MAEAIQKGRSTLSLLDDSDERTVSDFSITPEAEMFRLRRAVAPRATNDDLGLKNHYDFVGLGVSGSFLRFRRVGRTLKPFWSQFQLHFTFGDVSAHKYIYDCGVDLANFKVGMIFNS